MSNEKLVHIKRLTEGFSISKSGDVMTLKVGVASSMGYVRTMKERQDGNKEYITFYST
jgi:hypothetical protein